MRKILIVETLNLFPDILRVFFLDKRFCPNFHEIHENSMLSSWIKDFVPSKTIFSIIHGLSTPLSLNDYIVSRSFCTCLR